MYRLCRIVIIFIISSLMTACVSTQEIKPSENVAVDKSNGVVFASVTRSKRKVNLINDRPVDADFVIQPVSDDSSEIRTVKYDYDEGLFLSSHVQPLFGGQRNELKEYQGADGRVTSIYLPPGKYEVVGWSLSVNQTTQRKNFTPKVFKPQAFSVIAGEVTYLGNLHLDTIYAEKRILGTLNEIGAKSICSDKSARDIKEFKKKYKVFRDWSITKQLVKC